MTKNDRNRCKSYQIKIFACLAEEEALHSVLLGLVHDVVECCVTTRRQRVFVETFQDRFANAQVERILGGLFFGR